MATVADFRVLLPQFAAVDDATIQAWLDTAARTASDEFGDDQDTGQIYLAAHLMSLAGIGPEAGAASLSLIKSFRSGNVSMVKDDRYGEWGLTSYGRLFYTMWKGIRGGPRVTGTGEYPWPYGGEPPEDVNAV